MRNPFIATLLTAAAVTACGSESPADAVVGLATAVPAASHQANPARPLTGTCEATSRQPVSFAFPTLVQIGYAVCTISHLGKVTVVTEQTINVITGAQTGEGTWTAANGDLIYASSVGVGTPTGPGTISFTGVTTLAGGTGRFANASGVVDVNGTADNANGTGSFSYNGSITY
jgi:hypothetical protein